MIGGVPKNVLNRFGLPLDYNFNNGEFLRVTEMANRVTPHTPVFKNGLITGLTRGLVIFDGCTILLRRHSACIPYEAGQDVLDAQNQIEIGSSGEDFASVGDSGALVFINDDERTPPTPRIIAMVIGTTSYGTTIATPIEPVLDALQINIMKKT